MKKLVLSFLFIFLISVYSCSSDDDFNNTNEINITSQTGSFLVSNNEYLTLNLIKQMIGCDNVSYTGKGQTIAIIDSGVYPHNDLYLPQKRIKAFKDLTNNISEPYDDYGHGTAMSGIISGNGFVDREKIGIAPESDIVVVKVLDRHGNASINKLIKAINWVCNNKEIYDIKVVNISVGIFSFDQTEYEQLHIVIKKANDLGLLLITSVGNSIGKSDIFLPAAYDEVLTVGSVEDCEIKNPKEYKHAYFSSYWEQNELGNAKPDLLVPGNFMWSIKSDNTYTPNKVNHEELEMFYDVSFGTSNSAAIVSGAVALIFEKYPDETADFVKNYLYEHCIKLKSEEIVQGKGFLFLNNLK